MKLDELTKTGKIKIQRNVDGFAVIVESSNGNYCDAYKTEEAADADYELWLDYCNSVINS